MMTFIKGLIKQNNTDQTLSEYFKILSQPILTNIKIEYHNYRMMIKIYFYLKQVNHDN